MRVTRALRTRWCDSLHWKSPETGFIAHAQRLAACFVKMAEDLAQAARMLSQAAERLTTNIESSPSTSQTTAVDTAATDSGPGRIQRELSTLFPHHLRLSSSHTAGFNRPRRSVKRKASQTTTKAKRRDIK